ncbi:hypothetical protein HYQ46_011444 [Verticillium longisporum]|nr:hypothetical protein HYQ46_011444 [Verticillium longisporum]
MPYQCVDVNVLHPAGLALLDIASQAPSDRGGQVTEPHISTARNGTVLHEHVPEASILSLQPPQPAQDPDTVHPCKRPFAPFPCTVVDEREQQQRKLWHLALENASYLCYTGYHHGGRKGNGESNMGLSPPNTLSYERPRDQASDKRGLCLQEVLNPGNNGWQRFWWYSILAEAMRRLCIVW